MTASDSQLLLTIDPAFIGQAVVIAAKIGKEGKPEWLTSTPALSMTGTILVNIIDPTIGPTGRLRRIGTGKNWLAAIPQKTLIERCAAAGVESNIKSQTSMIRLADFAGPNVIEVDIRPMPAMLTLPAASHATAIEEELTAMDRAIAKIRELK